MNFTIQGLLNSSISTENIKTFYDALDSIASPKNENVFLCGKFFALSLELLVEQFKQNRINMLLSVKIRISFIIRLDNSVLLRLLFSTRIT